MATLSRHHHRSNHVTPHKTLPITMPTKMPAYHYPVSKVAMSPPELSDTSTICSGSRRSGGTWSTSSRDYAPSHRSDDYESNGYSTAHVDVMDMLSDRMNNVFDPIRMDKSMARQAQTSGELNAKQRELAELQALAQRRLKKARVNFDEGIEAAREARADLDYSTKKIASMKEKAARRHPDDYERARRRRQ